MKWIKSRTNFLEAKIRDVINSKQLQHVKDKWGEKYLDYEEVDATTKIKQGKWKLSESDKLEVLGIFCDCNMSELFKMFSSLPTKFSEVIGKSIDISLLGDESKIYNNFDINSPTLDQMALIMNNVFRKISSDTMSDSIIMKDNNGVPIKDENGQMMRQSKNIGDLVFSKNLININSFVSDYNLMVKKCIDSKVKGWKNSDIVNVDFSGNLNLAKLISYYKDNAENNYDVDIEIFNRDLYLSISHNPKDILNMSISKFYSSCQHLYGGCYNSKVLSNVFDPNSIPAFLIFETPILWEGEVISNHLPLSRMVIRSIESFSDDAPIQIFFDRAYPDRMKEIFGEIIEKYSNNIDNYESGDYLYTPDIDIDDRLDAPYQDKLDITKGKYIGKNTKTIYLSKIHDWSNIKIHPNSLVKELIIETNEIPENLTSIKLNLSWVKFKFLELNTLIGFENIKTNAIAFDKCKFSNNILKDIASINENINKIQIISCDNTSDLDFTIFKKLEELQIIYTANSFDDINLDGLNLKKLVISGDIVNKESKVKISSLKRNGVKVEIVGPVI